MESSKQAYNAHFRCGEEKWVSCVIRHFCSANSLPHSSDAIFPEVNVTWSFPSYRDVVRVKSTSMDKVMMERRSFECFRKDRLHFQYGLLFEPHHAENIMSRLEDEVRYSDPKDCMIKVYGKWYNIPRQQVAYGDPDVSYEYSGKKVQVLEWSPLMKELLKVVNDVCGHSYNFALINRYKDGTHRIGFHADDEDSIDMTAPIASLSFGAHRDFIFRHKYDKTRQKKLVLESGSLLLMEPPTNEYWHHSLPPCKNCKTPRVNLTFRKIKS